MKKTKRIPLPSLVEYVTSAIDAKRFDGEDGAISHINRLSVQFLSDERDPELVIKKLRMRVYSSASRFFNSQAKENPLWYIYLPRSLWYKYQARKLAVSILKEVCLSDTVSDNGGGHG